MDDIKGEELKSSFLIIPDSIQTKVLQGCGEFISGDLELPKGSKVYFQEVFRSYYKFPDGSERMIMDKELIFAYGDK